MLNNKALSTKPFLTKIQPHNTVQISKLETAIEAQKQKTDLLADIVKLHGQHLHQLDRMSDDSGRHNSKKRSVSLDHFTNGPTRLSS